jgi:hypothetical protein
MASTPPPKKVIKKMIAVLTPSGVGGGTPSLYISHPSLFSSLSSLSSLGPVRLKKKIKSVKK